MINDKEEHGVITEAEYLEAVRKKARLYGVSTNLIHDMVAIAKDDSQTYTWKKKLDFLNTDLDKYMDNISIGKTIKDETIEEKWKKTADNHHFSWREPKAITMKDEKKTINYLFSEDKLCEELLEYINKTYQGHYSGKYQATEMIIDAGHGIGFCVGNIMKYAKRYGKKQGYNKADIMKILHYAIILLHVHNMENEKE